VRKYKDVRGCMSLPTCEHVNTKKILCIERAMLSENYNYGRIVI
jgi:hypothetical protein